MNNELLPGMQFSAEHDLTKKELYVLIKFLEKGPMTTDQLAENLNANKHSLHHIITRLKLKKLLLLDSKGETGAFVYKVSL